jgi:hypothetical protein
MGWFQSIAWEPWLLLPLAFKIWMLVDCAQHEPDRAFWFWIVLLVPLAEFAYFFIRWLPRGRVQSPAGVRRWTRGREISRLETAARQIGNAHQWVQLGEALRDVGRIDAAGRAYQQALARDPEDPQALWGAALVDLEHKEFARALERLGTLMAIDPGYKFGDVSLAYGKTLDRCRGAGEALHHMEQHVRRWRQPEALFVLAEIHARLGNVEEARSQLESLLLDFNGSPPAFVRKHSVWRSRGRRLLRKLPRPASVSRSG